MYSAKEIILVMRELAASGNEFFMDALEEYDCADYEEKRDMEEWLADSFADHDDSIMDIKTALLLMQYPA